ncbi:MAG TPA: EAL domain-containing protein [Casimicrobiaceae bacterium]|nr:EAL domain-containing protein [Casimicrobiaceae bacterium]
MQADAGEVVSGPGGQRLDMDGEQDVTRRAASGWLARLHASLLCGFTGQAVAAVALAHAVLLPLLYAGALGGPSYAVAALVLSCAGVGFLGHRWARSIAELRAEIQRFATTRDGENPFQDSRFAGLDGLQRSLESLHRRVARRVQKLKAARDAAERESDANRGVVRQLARAQRIARVGSWDWDRAGNAVTCSDEVMRILGFKGVHPSPHPALIENFIHREDRSAFRRWMIKLARGGATDGLDVRITADDGELRHVHLLGEAVRDATGTISGVAGTIQDATERTRAIQQIHRLAYFDVLTELPNRSRFHEKLGDTLDAARRAGKSFAIMFLDLDRFKRINDTLGHAVGDDLLRVIAQRLTRGLRPDDMAGHGNGKAGDRDVCRQGGDEFIVLLNGVETEQEASRAATRLLAVLAQPIVIGTQEVFVSASIGIVLYPRDGGDLDTLLKNADVAMYHAKAMGRNRYYFYNDSMRAATAERLALEHDLRKALEAGQFELYYQPQIEVQGGKIVGVEALIRWNHPTLGLLGPAHFIGTAEEAGLIMDIWEWVLVTALIQHNAWLEQGLPAMTIAVNLSSVQFGDPALAERVREIARVVEVPLDHLELEVTESMLMGDFDEALKTLTELRAMGVKIAIDDFGTGYSSLAYLRRLPLDKLKLDQSFSKDAGQNEGDVAITRAVMAMAQSLKLVVVAEGVETQAQIDFLLRLGCTTVQGFLLGRPLPAAATADLLRESVANASTVAAPLSDDNWDSIVQSGSGEPGRRSAPVTH